MRKYEKKQCAGVLKTMEEAHKEIAKLIEKKEYDKVDVLLEECQQAAVAVGETIEKSEGEGTEAVSKLENYCEYLYEIHESLGNGSELNAHKIEKQLQKIANAAQAGINALPERIEVVFFPYKAAMWDSLESIWMAADADPNCDAYVVPIPYYDKNPDGTFAREHYEIDMYPEDVPVVRYTDYSHEEHHPDMIFVHNPYDEHNYVTSVHPAYFSYRLKEHTDCLVYVPYYATAGNMSEAQSILPSYFVFDYIIVQSPQFVGFFDKRVPREKLLPLGSPKFDKVIRLCENPPEPPAEWKKKMEGKRVFFYNTSINGCLEDTNAFLKKVAYVFSVFKGREDVCLLWRPHPLLESTIDSLRPEVKAEFLRLKESFINENIGILDETADIEKTIAICDAYIGDAGTSVTSLFGVVGKPMYILNNFLHEAPGEDDWLAWTGFPVRGDRNTKYCITMGNRLFVDRDGNRNYRYLCDLSDEYTGGGYYSQALEVDGKIVVFPNNAEHFLIIDPDTLSRERIEIEHKLDRDGAFSWSFNVFPGTNMDTYYIMPNRYPNMISFNVKTSHIEYYKDEAFDEEFSVYENHLQERIIAVRMLYLNDGEVFLSEMTESLSCKIEGTEKGFTAPDGSEHTYYSIRYPEIKGISLRGPKLLCFDVTGRRLRAIQLETKEVEEREIGLDGIYISVLRDVINPNVLWFLPYSGTKLCKWTLSSDRFEHVDVNIEGLKSYRRPQRYECEELYFNNGVFHEDKLILSPNWGNKFIEVDVNSHEIKEWIPPFDFTIEDKNDYWKNWGIGSIFRDSYDHSCKFYYSPEHILYDVDLEDKTATPIDTTFDKDDIYKLAAGFHRDSQWMPYVCFEDVFNSLDDIALGSIHGSVFEKERQIEAYCTINASPDGSCGDKVYHHLKSLQ